MPEARLLRIRKSVNPAHMSIPPIAIGRTMVRQTWVAMPDQVASDVTSAPAAWSDAVSSGPRKYRRSGTKRPQARRPPVKFSAASCGPMM